MAAPKIAIRLESLGLDFRRALESAARLGASGVQFDAVGELSARNLTQTGCRQIRHLIENHNLRLAGIGCPTRRGFDSLDQLDRRIEMTVETLKLAKSLGAPFLVNHIGTIPAGQNAARQQHFWDALHRINSEAERVGALFAIHPGIDGPDTLATTLGSIGGFGLAIHYDPANLLARGHSEIYDGIRTLGERIVGVYVKDVVRSGSSLSGYHEVPVGSGEIDWEMIIGALEEIAYRGFLTLAPESKTSAEAFADAIRFLAGI